MKFRGILRIKTVQCSDVETAPSGNRMGWMSVLANLLVLLSKGRKTRSPHTPLSTSSFEMKATSEYKGLTRGGSFACG